MSRPDRRALGKLGESLVCTHLQALGWQIVETNWRCQYGELDIVAREGEVLVLVEVRTRLAPTLGSPEESVDWRKQAKLRQLAMAYWQAHPEICDPYGEPPPTRIDVAAVEFDNSGKLVRLQILHSAVTDE